MEEIEQLKRLKEFLKENICHLKKMAKKNNVSLGEGPLTLEVKQRMIMEKYWILRDALSAMEGEI